MTVDLTWVDRGTKRKEWEEYYRELRRVTNDIHGRPLWKRHFWMNGKRLSAALPPGNYFYRTLNVRPYKWMTLLEDIEIIIPEDRVGRTPLVALLCHHARLGHDYVKAHYSITARLSEEVYQVAFCSMPAVLVRIVTTEEVLRGMELHSYEVVGPVSSRMIDIARSRLRD